MTLELKEVGFEYESGRRVLSGVTHGFRAGAVTGVVGPNGAGKSTLLRLLLGVLRPTSGRAVLDGRDVSGMAARERARRMAYIPQRTTPTFGFSVRECVGMGRLAWGGAGGDVVERALARVGLSDRGGEVFETLSAGQQQKAVLARSLAQMEGAERGGVLLADEPASALDPAHSLELMTIVRERAAAGATVVMVLHDFAIAGRFCDEVIVLGRGGEVAASGDAGRVLVPEVLDGVFGVRFVRGEQALVATAGPRMEGRGAN